MRNIGNELTIEVNGLIISYIDEGDLNAPVIIFVHGFPFNKWMWTKQITEFKNNFRVIAYDVRGFGDSEMGNVKFSVQLFSLDLIGLMDALHIEKATLCGLSMGGYIAFSAMANFPHRFSRLVLCDTKCAGDDAGAKGKRMKTIDSIKENGKDKYVEESLKILFSPNSFVASPAIVSKIREMITVTSEDVLIRTLHALAERNDHCGLLPSLNVPVMLVVGRDDVLTPPGVMQKMHEKIPGSVIHVIENAGHLSPLEKPEKFNRLLNSFLTDGVKIA